MSVWLWLAVGVLGGVFSVVRFLVHAVITARFADGFPWGTFAINISGCFALGLLVGTRTGGTAYLIAGTACIGSFTTFSTWMFEAHRLRERGGPRPLLTYVLASLLFGLAAVAVGRLIGEAL